MTRVNVTAMFLISFSLVAVACGRDRDSTPTGGTSLIRAAEGGTVLVDGSETQLAIPANALSEDTEIVLSVESPAGYPADADLREVIVMTPAGTELTMPASLVWQPSGEALTGSEQLSLVRLADGEWSVVDTGVTVGSGGVAHTTVTRLETYGLRVRQPVVGGEVGNIAGTVRHIYTEEPLPGIGITLYDQLENVIGTTASAADGSFSFSEIPAGDYFLIADVAPENNCFSDPTTKEAVILAGETTEVAFAFVPGPC